MRLALIAVLGLTVAACGDDSVTVDTSEENFCDQIADVVCHNLYQCCTESEVEDYLSVSEPRTEDQCRTDLVRSCERAAPDIRDSIKAGRVTFDPVKLNDCLNSLVAPEGVCAEVVTDLPWKDTCSTMNFPWGGPVAPEGQCFFSFDCAGAPDSFCGPDQKCKLKPTAGLPCSTSGECASMYYCGPNLTCAPRLSVGAPCTSSTQCGKDLFCDNKGTYNTTTDDVCATKVPGGSACTSEDACTSNDCISGLCMGSSFQTCFGDAGCQSHCAVSGFACDGPEDCGTGTCTGNSSITCGVNGDATCAANSAGTCLYPRSCLPGDCVGDTIGLCTMPTRTADYCTNLSNIPRF